MQNQPSQKSQSIQSLQNRESLSEVSKTYIANFLDDFWLESGASELTIESYKSDLELYLGFLDAHKIPIFQVEKQNIADFLDFCMAGAYTPASRGRFFASMRNWHNWCLEKNLAQNNPLLIFKSPKPSRKIPQVLTQAEVEKLLEAPHTTDILELRDKAMLELTYSSGLRVSELINLPLQKLDLNRGAVLILGKGQKERLLPIGETGVYWLEKYISFARPELLQANKTNIDEVFLNRRGSPMTRQNFWQRLKIYADRIDLQKPISPHGLRHAFATHLLNNGADLRVLQMLLGHSSLSVTQIYTSISDSRLDDLYRKNHPREVSNTPY